MTAGDLHSTTNRIQVECCVSGGHGLDEGAVV